MASSKKTSSGRSPLVNPQRQITAFFGKKPDFSSSASPSPSPLIAKQNPKPISASPITPLPLQSKLKPVLVIAPQLSSVSPRNPSRDKKLYGAEVVDRRLRVFWPLDKTWYEGCVKSFDKISGRHLVQYDDAEEETLTLSDEKIEWIEEPEKKKLRRLRKISVVEDEEEEDHEELEDDSDDGDWKEKVEDERIEDEEDSEDMDLELDEEEDSGKRGARKNVNSRKRKAGKGEVVGSTSGKKSKICEELRTKNGISTDSVSCSAEKLVEPTKRIRTDSGKASLLESPIVGDAAERFAAREAGKLRFLEIDRRDANRRRPRDANYDPKTLYLPPDFVKNLTGGQRQWWEFKSKNMDKVLFFKMGKFYELFEMDAHVGAKELGLQYMKVLDSEMACSLSMSAAIYMRKEEEF